MSYTTTFTGGFLDDDIEITLPSHDGDFYDKPVLVIPQGQFPETGDGASAFVLAGDIEVTMETVPNPLLEGVLGQANALVGQIGEAISEVAGGNTSVPQRRSIWLDLGAGTHSVTFDFRGWQGSGYTWGGVNDSGPLGDASDATGASATKQVQVLNRWLSTSTIGSFTPAFLLWGEYNPEGDFQEDYLPVAISSNRGVRSYQDKKSFDGSLECTVVQTFFGRKDAIIEEIT